MRMKGLRHPGPIRVLVEGVHIYSSVQHIFVTLLCVGKFLTDLSKVATGEAYTGFSC